MSLVTIMQDSWVSCGCLFSSLVYETQVFNKVKEYLQHHMLARQRHWVSLLDLTLFLQNLNQN